MPTTARRSLKLTGNANTYSASVRPYSEDRERLNRAPFGSSVAGQPGARFNDTTGGASSARKVVLFCTPQTAGDVHCDYSVGVQYAQGSTANTFELWARSPRQVEVSKKAGLYKLQ